MLTIRKANDRGAAEHGWLSARHSFSFAGYHDRAHMGFRSLRVINEDKVMGGQGFGMHGHENMEILTYIVSGGLSHRDSMGHESTIYPGDVQYMSAGSGIQHAEFNGSATDLVHLLQIWIMPDKHGTKPRYGDKDFAEALSKSRPVLVGSPDGRDGSFELHADALVYAARPKAGSQESYPLKAGRGAWLQVVKGTLEVNGKELHAGDAISAENEAELAIRADSDADYLLFDLA